MAALTPARIREQLGYPIIDGDGHFLEVGAVFREHLYEVAGTATAARIEQIPGTPIAGIHGGRLPGVRQLRSERPPAEDLQAIATSTGWAPSTRMRSPGAIRTRKPRPPPLM